MNGNSTDYNPLTSLVYEYFSKQGKSISQNILRVLDKSLLELNEEEQGIYESMVLPTRDAIKQALRAQLLSQNAETLRDNLAKYQETIIGKMILEVIGEPLPQVQQTQQVQHVLQAQQTMMPSPRKSKAKAWIIGTVGTLVVVGVALAVMLVVFRGDKGRISYKEYSLNGLKIEVPKGYEAAEETMLEYESCDLEVSCLRVFPEKDNSAVEGIYIKYPEVRSEFFSNDYFDSHYQNVEDTNIGGRRAIICNKNPNAPDWVGEVAESRSERTIIIYLPEEQLYLEGEDGYKQEMIKIAESAVCNYRTFNNVPEPFQGGYEDLVGTWESDKADYTVRIGYNQDDGMVYGLVAMDESWMFSGEADGWMVYTTDIDFGTTGLHSIGFGEPFTKISLIGDGSQMFMMLGNIDLRNVSPPPTDIYTKISSDPVYGLSTSSTSDLPPFPKYISAEEQWNSGYATGPVWSVTASASSVSTGGSINLNSQWNHGTPGSGYQLWFLIETPSGKKYGKLMEVVSGEIGNVEFAGIYDATFPNDFSGATSTEKGRYQVFFVEYWPGENPSVVNYACTEFTVQ